MFVLCNEIDALLQFLTLDEERIQCTEDTGEGDIDLAVTETWKFVTDYYHLVPPKLIISVIHDSERFSMNQRLLKSILFDLVNSAATESEGMHSHECYAL